MTEKFGTKLQQYPHIPWNDIICFLVTSLGMVEMAEMRFGDSVRPFPEMTWPKKCDSGLTVLHFG